METSLRALFFLLQPRLKPTYEGWKLSTAQVTIGADGSLKPTYEGWKHPKNIKKPAIQHSLKPTYEGWKPTVTRHVTLDTAAFEAYL